LLFSQDTKDALEASIQGGESREFSWTGGASGVNVEILVAENLMTTPTGGEFDYEEELKDLDWLVLFFEVIFLNDIFGVALLLNPIF
jgi:catalase (peroxidase I)